MRCPACGASMRRGTQFCEDCGVGLAAACPSCGSPTQLGKRFCGDCGAPIDDVSAREQRGVGGEHKPVTVMFCDIVGSTGLAERIGTETMHEVVGRFFDLAMDEIGRYGGSVNKFMGDGFMALMGVPVAHEDHARRAVLAALSLRRRIDAELNPTLPEPLVVRTGLSTGLVVVGGVGGDPGSKVTAIGDTVNVAARLERLADPGPNL